MAGSSKKFVYIPSIRKETWLLWSKKANTVCLREYTADRVKKIKSLGLQEANALLSQSDSRVDTNACYNTIPSKLVGFWFQLSNSLNVRDRLVPADDKDKLQAIFKLRCMQPLLDGEVKQLQAIFDYWKSLFSSIREKEAVFNAYDCKDTTGRFKADHGKSWQSQLLELSRKDGKGMFVDTGHLLTDFSLVCMELTFAISAKNNPIFPGAESRIAPDGLGIRRNGFLTILEIKGPSDDSDLLGPLLQATCGALAVVAKKDRLCEIARTSNGLRPKYGNARVPKKRSVGIHILTAKHKKKRKLESWSPDTELLCKRVLQAFPQLQYIAYSFVVPEDTNGFTKIQVDHLITQE